MTVVITADATEFRNRAEAFLAENIDCNVLATVLMGVLDGRYDKVRPVFAWELDASGSVTGAALRTPPHALISSRLDPETIEPLLEAWLRLDPELPGVNGPPQTARGLAAAWSRTTGGGAELARSMAMHSLQSVTDPPRPPQGHLRPADGPDRQSLIEWWQAFFAEVGGHGGADPVSAIDVRLATGTLFVWDADGPVSLVAIQPAVAGVVRVGPVYTPPDRRRHGYAGMAVAEVSRLVLASGATTCMLFTDLSNPTSNKIYAEVGYRPFADWEEYEFTRSRSTATPRSASA